MIFTEYLFVIFFLVVFSVSWSLRGNHTRKVFLLVVSYLFYAAWDYRFLGLIVISTLVDYFVGRSLGRPAARRGVLLAVSLVANLGMLGVFKYLDFFVDSTERFLQLLGFSPNIVTLQLILPVGISFYTFQTLSYTIDVYRGKLQPTRNLIDLALFVGFFPQLVAGPIVRAKQFLPQLVTRPRWSDVDVRSCLVIFGVGFVQKAVIADNFSIVVDRYFANPDAYTTPGAWLGVLAFAAQLYGDFAGYSNMAIGAAGLVGYTLPINFDFPYLRRNFAASVRSWHITLTAWFRDYVYVPLRTRFGRGVGSHYVATLITMALVGLWHGPSWRFVIWGVLMGVGIVGYQMWHRLERRLSLPTVPPWAGAVIAYGLTGLFWMLMLVIFRSQDLGAALRTLGHLAGLGAGSRPLTGRIWYVAFAAVATIHMLNKRDVFRWWARMPWWMFAFGFGFAAQMAVLLAGANQRPFIYFQF